MNNKFKFQIYNKKILDIININLIHILYIYLKFDIYFLTN